MSYKTYDAYETIDNSFLKQMPKDWEMFKLKFLINTLESGKRKDFENETFAFSIGGEHINWNGTLNLKNERYVSEDFYNSMSKGKICKNDTLLVKDGATIGKTAFVDNLPQKMAVNEHVFILRSNKLLNPKLLYYLIFSNLGFTQIKLTETGSAQGGISQSIADKVEFIIPINLTHQQQIVDYLDKQTAKIDATIAKNEELIKLLEEKRVTLINQVVTKGLNPDVSMKDSGVKWIGEIPEHWGVEKIKNLSEVKPSNVDKKTKDNEPSVLLCNYTDVYNNEFITMDLDFMKATATYDQIKKLSLNVGDIIITKDSESADDIAVPAIVTEKLENVVCGYHLAVIRPNEEKIYPKFLFRSFESDKINKQFEHGANGVTRFGLGTYPIKNAYVCQPPLSEQKEIANYLDNENSKIYKATNKIIVHTDLLEEYKTSLIHNVVTGKIDVREEVI